MDISFLLPGNNLFALTDIQVDDEQNLIQVQLKSEQEEIRCPKCGQDDVRIHSYYHRVLADLPWANFKVRLEIHVRKFFCQTKACPCRVFTERFSDVIAPWARRTRRLASVQTHLALTVSGSVGERLSQPLLFPVSLETLLRLIRQQETTVSHTPRVLGIDDWAKRKGQSYGTILVDLETHEVIDVLPDRTAQTVAEWLQAHPGVEIISRDRAGEYAAGAKAGAPNAIQIADRWHLLKNLGDAFTRFLDRYRKQLRTLHLTVFTPIDSDQPQNLPVEPRIECNQLVGDPWKRAERLARYQRVLELRALGWTQKTIAGELYLSSKTVGRWLAHGCFPERHRRSKRQRIDPYKPYILQRWQDGCRNAAQIFRELQQQGYTGGRTMVVDYMARLRREHPFLVNRTATTQDPQQPKLTPRHLTMLLFKLPEDRDDQQRSLLETVLQQLPQLEPVVKLIEDFIDLVRLRKSHELDGWLERAFHIQCLRAFVRGIRRDYAAVWGAVSTEWSNGQVEGQVNRLKFIKRQMYGRAKFDLLRKRVLLAD